AADDFQLGLQLGIFPGEVSEECLDVLTRAFRGCARREANVSRKLGVARVDTVIDADAHQDAGRDGGRGVDEWMRLVSHAEVAGKPPEYPGHLHAGIDRRYL